MSIPMQTTAGNEHIKNTPNIKEKNVTLFIAAGSLPVHFALLTPYCLPDIFAILRLKAKQAILKFEISTVAQLAM